MSAGMGTRAIPVLPVLSGLDDFGLHDRLPSILDVGQPIWLNSGSSAIFVALKNASVSPGEDVLLPAFHCPTMVAPIRGLGARPIYYGISNEFDISLTEIEARITDATRAILVPHLFGHVQSLRPIREFCDELGIVLIEDCAHMFFGEVDTLPVGSIGHYSIASPRKFFPLSEGGVLTSQARSLDLACVTRSGVQRIARTVFDILDISVHHDRLRGLSPLVAGAKGIRALSKSRQGTIMASHQVDSILPTVKFASAATPAAVGLYSYTRLAARRRANYLRLKECIDAVANMTVLNVLDQRAIPYMVPVLLGNPPVQLEALKANGLPTWRWEYSVRGVCEVTDHFADALIQVPCHQSLNECDLRRMVAAISSAHC